MGLAVDMGGLDLNVNSIKAGATRPGMTGTDIGSAQGVTNLSVINLTQAPTAGGATFDLDSATASLTSNAVTATKWSGTITSEALTTAAGASQAFVITLAGVAAGDLAFVQRTGQGTNTRKNFNLEAATTTNTLTVTLNNTEPTNAINGSVVFNYWILKK